MDFVQPLAKKRAPLLLVWQRNTCEAMGDAFYSLMASGRILFRFNNMKMNQLVTPSQAALAPVELLSFQRWQLLETCHARWR
jgi:hypothetical protein